MSTWLEEARALHERVGDAIPKAHRGAVRAFLAEAPPPDAPRDALALCHDDLGIEHVLMDGHGTVTGVIDWGDAAVTDPAGDLGRIHRDLGPAALDAASPRSRRPTRRRRGPGRCSGPAAARWRTWRTGSTRNGPGTSPRSSPRCPGSSRPSSAQGG